MTRNQTFNSDWDDGDYAVIGIPMQNGEDVTEFLARAELAGHCRLEKTQHVMLHSDGRHYRDVAIHRGFGGASPQEIANQATAYLPDDSLVDADTSAAIERGH